MLFRYTSNTVLRNTFKVLTGTFSRNSMNANREPKRIISGNNMLLQYSFMFSFQFYFLFLKITKKVEQFLRIFKKLEIFFKG